MSMDASGAAGAVVPAGPSIQSSSWSIRAEWGSSCLDCTEGILSAIWLRMVMMDDHDDDDVMMDDHDDDDVMMDVHDHQVIIRESDPS